MGGRVMPDLQALKIAINLINLKTLLIQIFMKEQRLKKYGPNPITI